MNFENFLDHVYLLPLGLWNDNFGLLGILIYIYIYIYDFLCYTIPQEMASFSMKKSKGRKKGWLIHEQFRESMKS